MKEKTFINHICAHSRKLSKTWHNDIQKCVTNARLLYNIPNNVAINITFHRKHGNGIVGSAQVDDGQYYIDLYDRFKNDHKLSKYLILVTLCHELIHVSQFHRGDLVDNGDGLIWRGKYFSNDSIVKDGIKQHANRPWEVEAIAMADPLYRTFLRNKRYMKNTA